MSRCYWFSYRQQDLAPVSIFFVKMIGMVRCLRKQLRVYIQLKEEEITSKLYYARVDLCLFLESRLLQPYLEKLRYEPQVKLCFISKKRINILVLMILHIGPVHHFLTWEMLPLDLRASSVRKRESQLFPVDASDISRFSRSLLEIWRGS